MQHMEVSNPFDIPLKIGDVVYWRGRCLEDLARRITEAFPGENVWVTQTFPDGIREAEWLAIWRLDRLDTRITEMITEEQRLSTEVHLRARAYYYWERIWVQRLR